MDTYVFREATIADVEEIELLNEQAEARRKGRSIPKTIMHNEMLPKRRKALEQPGVWSRLAYDDGRLLAAMVGYSIDSHSEHLRWLMVHPNYWGQGIASQMLDWMVERFEKEGKAFIDLWTEDTNYRAQELYKRKGFHATGLERDHAVYHEHQLQFRLDI